MISLTDVKGITGREDPILLAGYFDLNTGKIRIISRSRGFRDNDIVKELLPENALFIDDLVEGILGKISKVRFSELHETKTDLEGYIRLKREEFERYKQGEGRFLLQANVVSNGIQVGHIHMIGGMMDAGDLPIENIFPYRYFLIYDEYDLTLQNRARRTRLHDILNRLINVVGFLRRLGKATKEQDSEGAKRCIEIVLQEGTRLEDMLRDPLRAKVYEKIESGRYEPRPVMLKKDIIDPALGELAYMAMGKGIIIDFEHSLTEDIQVFVDPEVYQIAYIELFTNAIKNGRRRVTYGLEMNPFRINGFNFGENCGIANVYNECDQLNMIKPEDREIVFQPGYKKSYAGYSTGQGLATVRRIIEAHGGRIRVDPTIANPGTNGEYRVNFQFGIPLYKG